MRRWFVAVFLVCSLLLSSSRPYQGTIDIESLTIDLWPEFDRPEMLVMYHITLAPQFQTFSQRISIRIPREAGKPFALASRALDGTLYDIKDYDTVADGDWIRVTFIPTGSEIQLEYYDPRLQKSGAARNYEYRWPGDYGVKSLGVSIQQPMNASKLTTTPPIGAGTVGSDGLTYFNFVWGGVNAGTNFALRLSYEKPDDKLTMDTSQQQVKPAAPITTSNTSPATIYDTLPWLLGFLGVAMIVGVVIWYWRTDRQTAPPSSRRRKKGQRPRESGPEPKPDSTAVVFCQQCGKKASPGDVYCRSCGTKLRYD